MRINTVQHRQPERTHEDAPAPRLYAAQELRRSVMACLLWEHEFYESGQTIADRIKALVPQVDPDVVAAMAIDARSQMHLRHVPLLLVREMARHRSHRRAVRSTLPAVIQRADELAEFLAIYWKDGREKLAKSIQRGLADAFVKFSPYQLAKYNRDGAVKLRDVLFLSHAKPRDDAQAEAWKQLIAGTLPAPDTWEVILSAGAEKRATWERLIAEKKLGALALLRNLRNMQEAQVPDAVIAQAIREMRAERVLPFRFLAAARYAPQFVSELDAALLQNALQGSPTFKGLTVIVVDVSGSMTHPVSQKSDLRRMEAAAGVAVLARERCERSAVVTFSDALVQVPAYRGLALASAILDSQPHAGTRLGKALHAINAGPSHDRIIVITDEQSHDQVPGPNGLGYLINVASNRCGVGYGPWVHIDGWSERVIEYIEEVEQGDV